MCLPLPRGMEIDQGVMECLGHFHTTRSQAFACAKMASVPNKLRQTWLSTSSHSPSSEQSKGKDPFIHFHMYCMHNVKPLYLCDSNASNHDLHKTHLQISLNCVLTQ